MQKRTPSVSEAREDLAPRDRILAAGVALVAEKGVQGATTRAIAAAARVQHPTIFRHFGDKIGLLDAIATKTMADFLASTLNAEPHDDPIAKLKARMERFMSFGVGNPDVFTHMYARGSERSPVYNAGYKAMQEWVHHVGRLGRLAVSEERACDIIHGMARGTVFEMLDRPEKDHPEMIRTASGVAISGIILDSSVHDQGDVKASASTLRAYIEDVRILTDGERILLKELLVKIVEAQSTESKHPTSIPTA